MIKFFNISSIFVWIEKLINFINSIFFILLLIAISIALIFSPADYLQGDSVRIMYVHVPAAWIALGSFSSLALLSDENIPTTIQDALDFQKQLNLNAMEQKKEIFSRVLNSLSGDDNLAATMTLSKEITEILEERKLQEEEKRIIEEKERKEKEMDDYLKQQKERLSLRFNPDSEDSQGINPLADIDAYENQPKYDDDNRMLLSNSNGNSNLNTQELLDKYDKDKYNKIKNKCYIIYNMLYIIYDIENIIYNF